MSANKVFLSKEFLPHRRYPTIKRGRKEWTCSCCGSTIKRGEQSEHSYSPDMSIEYRICLTCLQPAKLSDYAKEIETAFTGCRGKFKSLTAADLEVIGSWEKTGIPLRVTLRAIEICCQRFHQSNPGGLLNSVKYFDREVQKAFAEWKASQAGKHVEPAIDPDDQPNEADHAITRCEEIILAFGRAKATAPKDLRNTFNTIGPAVLQIILEIESDGDIEKACSRLEQLGRELDRTLLATAEPADRDAVKADFRRQFPRAELTVDIADRMLLKSLYTKYGLPRLSLYEV